MTVDALHAETFDLAQASIRDLNAALHALTPDTNRTLWRVQNPRGQHALAVGVDAPVRIEIAGHAGYYCAGMNQGAAITIHGNAGNGVAENMMSGRVHVRGDDGGVLINIRPRCRRGNDTGGGPSHSV
jgi:glutamate synthase domain-containing protein 3